MDIQKLQNQLKWLPASWLARVEKYLFRIPAVREQIEAEYDNLMVGMEESLKPYRREFGSYNLLPKTGLEQADILHQLESLKNREESRWKDGFVSGAVYHGDQIFTDFLNQVYAIHSQANPMHTDVWPSSTKFEAEIVAMTAEMLGAADTEGEICGTVNSGGTESILLAMKSYRDRAREERGLRRPEMIAPSSAHTAFDKAAQYFGIKLIRTPVTPDFRADVNAIKRAINHNTIVIIGSAPCFPHGVIDPIEELSTLAQTHGIGFHTDACLGGFVLPWAEKLGYPVPAFNFRLTGVTSMSADTHKYGFAAKGTSVVLYRGLELRRFQYFTAADWPGGLYFSPTLAGSRPGSLSAVCWAAMLAMGQDGYMKATKSLLETASVIKAGIADIPELYLLGDPMWILAFGSDTLNIYQVMDQMIQSNWSLNPLQKPIAVHIALTLRHTQPGVAEKFIHDLRQAVQHVMAHPQEESGSAPVYGMAATIPLRGLVREMLRRFTDILYKV
ncbi:MAG: aminotransferase class V-fold PLP-dependent enzyme [Chloroflexota bacterium]